MNNYFFQGIAYTLDHVQEDPQVLTELSNRLQEKLNAYPNSIENLKEHSFYSGALTSCQILLRATLNKKHSKYVYGQLFHRLQRRVFDNYKSADINEWDNSLIYKDKNNFYQMMKGVA